MGFLAALFMVFGVLNGVGIFLAASVNPDRVPLRVIMTVVFLGLGFACNAVAKKKRAEQDAG